MKTHFVQFDEMFCNSTNKYLLKAGVYLGFFDNNIDKEKGDKL